MGEQNQTDNVNVSYSLCLLMLVFMSQVCHNSVTANHKGKEKIGFEHSLNMKVTEQFQLLL